MPWNEGMKDNSKSALSTNKEAISNATMNLMESSIDQPNNDSSMQRFGLINSIYPFRLYVSMWDNRGIIIKKGEGRIKKTGLVG